jgi:predicted AAA+ superfamily ATPase
MKRAASKSLVSWFKNPNRKPMVLRGARQVGKSTLVQLFAHENQLDLMEVNLERHLYLNDIFKTYDIDKILKELQAVCGKRLHSSTLIFLDEIQAAPEALACLRYFKEDRPDIAVIAAGSLLEFTLADHSFSMPVGRIEYRHLGPMSFKEFLQEISPELIVYLEEIHWNQAIPEAAHLKLLDKLREYVFVGGMPEAVKVYKASSSLQDVQEVHRSINDTYQDDFAKYAQRKDLVLLQKIFRTVPSFLGQKVKYSNISREHRALEVRGAIDLLVKARVFHEVFASSCSGLPLDAQVNHKILKLISLDIGLLNYQSGLDWMAINSMSEKQLINEGILAEQLVGQQLLADLEMKKKPQLIYWLREGRSANAEVDYVYSRANYIIPIEVKSGKSGSLKSLQQFMFLKPSQLALRFDLNPISMQHVNCKVKISGSIEEVDFPLLSLPLYAIEELPRLIDEYRTLR